MKAFSLHHLIVFLSITHTHTHTHTHTRTLSLSLSYLILFFTPFSLIFTLCNRRKALSIIYSSPHSFSYTAFIINSQRIQMAKTFDHLPNTISHLCLSLALFLFCTPFPHSRLHPQLAYGWEAIQPVPPEGPGPRAFHSSTTISFPPYPFITPSVFHNETTSIYLVVFGGLTGISSQLTDLIWTKDAIFNNDVWLFDARLYMWTNSTPSSRASPPSSRWACFLHAAYERH